MVFYYFSFVLSQSTFCIGDELYRCEFKCGWLCSAQYLHQYAMHKMHMYKINIQFILVHVVLIQLHSTSNLLKRRLVVYHQKRNRVHEKLLFLFLFCCCCCCCCRVAFSICRRTISAYEKCACQIAHTFALFMPSATTPAFIPQTCLPEIFKTDWVREIERKHISLRKKDVQQ